MICNHWKTIPFGKIAEFKNGLNFRAGEKGYQIKILGVGDFQQRTTLDQVEGISAVHTEKEVDESYHLQDGDLVFVRSNGNKALVGRCLLVFTHGEKITYSGFTIRARLQSSKVMPEFINLLMQGGLLRNALKRDGRGTNISNLNQDMLSKLAVPVPALHEQKAILDFLGAWDTAIEKTEALIAAKERQFGWLVHELISKRKPEVSLAEVCSLVKGQRFSRNENDLDYLEIGDVDVNTKDYQICNKEKKPVLSAVKVPANTLLVSTVRPTRGAITRTKSEIYVSSAFCKLKPKNDFYFYCLHQKKFLNHLKARQSGATYPTVKDSDILTFKIPILSDAEQKKVVQTLNTAEREIKFLKRLVEKYRTQKRGLMQKLLTGEWRLSAATEDAA